MPMRASVLVVLAGALVLAGCTSTPPPGTTPPASPPPTSPPPTGTLATFAYTATEYTFSGPASVPGGLLTLELRNQGQEPHELAVLRIENHTFAEFRATFEQLMATPDPNATGPPPEPEWAKEAGGVGAVGPGGSARVTQQLAPGTYALVCFVPDPHGMPHIAHGMAKELTVTTAPIAVPPTPQADVQVGMVDLNFTQQPDPPAAGNHTIRVRNLGQEPHQTQVFGLKGNLTVQQLLAFFGEGPPEGSGSNESASNESAPPPPGPPPFSIEGGVAPMLAGGEAWFSADLKPGRYVYICFVDGHFARGMVKEFAVA